MRLWSAPYSWATADVRRRWRSLVVLGLLAGVTASLAISAFAGARRTDTALARLDHVTNAPDAIIFASQVLDLHPDWSRLAARPEVAQFAVWDLFFCNINGQEGGLLFASGGDGWLTRVDKPVVIQGRMFNPRADNEMVVNEQVAAQDHVHVGDVLHIQAYASDQPNAVGTPRGPMINLRVVGVVRTAEEYLFVPGALVSPGVVEKYRHRAAFAPNAVVRLTNGEAGMAALRRDVDSLVAPGIPVLDLHDTSRRVTTTLAVESFALYMIALAVALAGGLLVAQVLSRSTSFVGDDVATLRSIGMTRRDIAAAATMSNSLAIAVALVVGLAGAVALSPLFPLGMGRGVDPDVGVHADWTALGAGVALIVVPMAAGTVILALAASSREARHVAGQRSAVAAWLARVGPVPIGIGARMALERGPGARSMPVRPALLGAVIGVLGVVGALTINAAIHHALDHPELAGVTWGASVTPPAGAVTSSSVSGPFVAAVGRAAPGGSEAVVRRDLVDVDGVGVPTFSVQDEDASRSAVTLAVVSGHAPTAMDEAAIGPATAKLLGVRVGSWVVIGRGQKVHLVGEALFPSDVHSEFDEGLWLTPAAFDSEVPPPLPSNPDEVVAVRFTGVGNQEQEAISAAEADVEGNPISTGPIGKLAARLGLPMSALNSDVEPVNVPPELTNLEDLSQLPIVLGVFLAVLGLAALSYVLVVSGRSRRAEFAIYKALGLDGKMSRHIVYFQASVIATIGLVIGVPLGIIVGRWGWSAVATRVPLVDIPPLSILVVVLTIPIVLAASNAIAIWPAIRVARAQPAEALRSE
jgi:ABC-type lipoprotein release transport system permease subunit